jgi:energy-coupling factor transporter transmembrane protein EcfT
MFNTMVGKYYPIDSKIHKMNSTSKVICIIAFILILAFSNSLLSIIFMTILTIGMMFLSNVPLILYLKNINSIKVLLIFIVIMNIIFSVSIETTIIILLKIILGVLYFNLNLYYFFYRNNLWFRESV